MTKEQIIMWATPVVVPLIIQVVKTALPKIPKKYLPVLCPIIGAAIDVIASGTIGTGTAWGSMLGLSGIGVREVWNQWTKGSDGSGGTTAALFLVGLLACGSLMGCAMVTQKADTTNPDGTRKTSYVRGYTVIQSAQALAQAQAQNGEVQRVGMSGLEQKTDGVVIAQAMVEMVKLAAQAYMGGGYSPSPGIITVWKTNIVTLTNVVPAPTNQPYVP